MYTVIRLERDGLILKTNPNDKSFKFQGGGTLHAQLEVWKAACCDTTPCFDNQASPSAPSTTSTSTATTAPIKNPWSPVEECPSVEASDGNYSFVFPILTTLIIWLLCHKIRSNIDDIKNAYHTECFFLCCLFYIQNRDIRFDEMTSMMIKQRNAQVKLKITKNEFENL